LYVDKQSAGRLEVVRRPRLVGGEVEGMGRLKGDLDLVGEELLGELRVGLGERDGLGVEADPGGEGGCMSTTRTAGTICWLSSSLRRPAGRVLFAVGTAIGRVGSGELSTGGAGLVEGFGACRLAL